MRGDIANPDQQGNEDPVKEIITIPAPANPFSPKNGKAQFETAEQYPGTESDDDAEIGLADRRLSDLASQAASPEDDQEQRCHIPGQVVDTCQAGKPVNLGKAVIDLSGNLVSFLEKRFVF